MAAPPKTRPSTPRRRGEPEPVLKRARAAISEPAWVPGVDSVGEYAEFVWDAIKGIRRVGPYAAEVLRQTALIATGSMLVIVFVSFLAGATCGLEAAALARSLGAGIAGPIFSAFCTTREVVPFIFGF